LGPLPEGAAAFSSTAGSLRAVGQLAGMVGYVAFATNLVLGARIPAVERLFGALDRMYRFHRRLGASVAALLVVHVALMIGSQALLSPVAAVALVQPDSGWRVFAGVLAAAPFAVVLVLTLVPRLGHEAFVRVHRFLGVVFGIAALHALRVSAFAAESPVLKGYLFAVTGAGIAAWMYRSGLGRSLVRRHYYKVAEVRPLHPLVNEVTLTPLEEPLKFSPGQLVFIGIDDEAVTRELHPFSITSAPGEEELRLVVKAIGDYTTDLRNVAPGAWAMVEGPYGGFWHDSSKIRRQIWIAGGIGVTPFLSIARSFDPTDHEVDFYYATEDAESALFLDELFAIADQHPELRVIPFRADSLGFLTAQDVRAASGDLSDTHIFMCGPPAMMLSLATQFEDLGVPERQLHYEDFRLRPE
jgi:predicted ferric reductase